MSVTQTTVAKPKFSETVATVLAITLAAVLIYLLAPFAIRQYYGTPAPEVQAPAPAPAPALIVPTPRPLPAPVYVQAPAPVIVQEVPAGQVPQPIQVQPAAPAPVQAENAPAVEPAPAPIIIVHQVSSDGAHQTITGSGACKVAKVAARCSK